MAIYTGGMRMKDEAKAASKRIATQQAKAQKAEAKRKGRAGIFGKLGGMALGTLAVGAMGLTGGLAAPLVMGAATSLGKKWADEGSKGGGMFGDTFKTPGQVDKITAGGKYGYGRGEAKSLTDALSESRKTEWDIGTLAGDVGGSMLSAAGTDTLGAALGKTGVGQKFADWQARTSGVGGEEFGAKVTEQGLKDNPFLEEEDFWDLGEEVIAPQHQPDFGAGEPLVFGQDTQGTGPLSPLWEGAQGGQVPQQQQLMQLLALMSQQQETAYSGTALEEKQPSTIADMFASQGKTLGGNNTQSLSQMLGR